MNSSILFAAFVPLISFASVALVEGKGQYYSYYYPAQPLQPYYGSKGQQVYYQPIQQPLYIQPQQPYYGSKDQALQYYYQPQPYYGSKGGSSWTSGTIWNSACSDSDTMCPHWALSGECTRNPNYMQTFCRLSCGICGEGSWGAK